MSGLWSAALKADAIVLRASSADKPIAEERSSNLQRLSVPLAIQVCLMAAIAGLGFSAPEQSPLKRFVRREKHARVPQEHIEDGVRLGKWVRKQRTSYKKNSLEPARIQALESVKGWIWDAS